VSIFVKICGNASQADARAVAACKPDAMGFILWPGSKRYVAADALANWIPELPPDILKVGVFVDAMPAEVDRAMRIAGLDVAQLHGTERPEDYAHLRRRLWRVARVPGQDPALAGAWPVDALLVDTYSDASPGGTGIVGDWPAAAAFVAAVGKPVLLAGGLTPLNVAEAVRAVRPWGVDVSSGVEMAPGRKDLRKVREFMKQCRTL
jgi:phosphoribosylanthranilate isomerase